MLIHLCCQLDFRAHGLFFCGIPTFPKVVDDDDDDDDDDNDNVVGKLIC